MGMLPERRARKHWCGVKGLKRFSVCTYESEICFLPSTTEEGVFLMAEKERRPDVTLKLFCYCRSCADQHGLPAGSHISHHFAREVLNFLYPSDPLRKS